MVHASRLPCRSPFPYALQVCGRQIARHVIELAGLPGFWDGQHKPPAALLAQAKQHICVVANIMQLPHSEGATQLVQGEATNVLLAAIGKTLSQQDSTGGKGGAAAAAQGGLGGGLRGSGVGAEKVHKLRALVVLMHLLAGDLGRYALQVRG